MSYRFFSIFQQSAKKISHHVDENIGKNSPQIGSSPFQKTIFINKPDCLELEESGDLQRGDDPEDKYQ